MKLIISILRWVLILVFLPLIVALTLVMDICRFVIVRYTAMILELYRDCEIPNAQKVKYDTIIGLDITNKEMRVLNDASGYVTRIKREINSETTN